VYQRNRADLLGVLDSTLSPLFLGQLKNLHKACLSSFKKELLEGLRGEEYNFADVVGKARTKCETRFADGAKEVLLEDTDWTWQDELESLKEEISNVADQCRKDETKKMVNLIERAWLVLRAKIDAMVVLFNHKYITFTLMALVTS